MGLNEGGRGGWLEVIAVDLLSWRREGGRFFFP